MAVLQGGIGRSPDINVRATLRRSRMNPAPWSLLQEAFCFLGSPGISRPGEEAPLFPWGFAAWNYLT